VHCPKGTKAKGESAASISGAIDMTPPMLTRSASSLVIRDVGRCIPGLTRRRQMVLQVDDYAGNLVWDVHRFGGLES
jgi:hypothetical protein